MVFECAAPPPPNPPLTSLTLDVCVCPVCVCVSAEVTLPAHQTGEADMAVVAYFLRELIEASDPRAKIFTHNSFQFFFLNV